MLCSRDWQAPPSAAALAQATGPQAWRRGSGGRKGARAGRRQVRMQYGYRDQLIQPKDLPLTGRRVMITAPRQYASRLADRLVDAGARPLWVPSIVITSISRATELEELDAALTSLDQFTHLAFTSSNGISAVMSRLAHIYGGQEGAFAALQHSGIRCGALGADCDALEDRGVKCDIRPAEASTLGLVRELQAIGEAQGARVLCPVPSVEGSLVEPPVVARFLNALQDAGATPTRVPAYVTRQGSHPEGCRVETELLQSGGIDAIAFTSTAEVLRYCVHHSTPFPQCPATMVPLPFPPFSTFFHSFAYPAFSHAEANRYCCPACMVCG